MSSTSPAAPAARSPASPHGSSSASGRRGAVHSAQRHDSAARHVAGSALYIDDLPEPPGTLHAALVLSPLAHGRLQRLDLAAARAAAGVACALSAAEIPGRNDIAAIGQGEELFASEIVSFAGQPLAVIAADTLDHARAAAGLVQPQIEPLPPILGVDAALAANSLLQPPSLLQRGDAQVALHRAPHRLTASLRCGGQEHFYLEGQIALALPGEEGDIVLWSSTQHPTECQHIAARVLGCDFNRITVQVRRLGGGFGGKESNASWVAATAALLAAHCRRPVKLRLPRSIDMLATGKRHGFLMRYEIGFDASGRVLALDALLAADGGHSLDLTPGVLARAMTHVDNCYFIPDLRLEGRACRTNIVSSTAFRGFGGPQGMLLMEDALHRIAATLGRDIEQVRERNFYRRPARAAAAMPQAATEPTPGDTAAAAGSADATTASDLTPYGQPVDPEILQRVVSEARRRADWQARRRAIDDWNAAARAADGPLRRGLALFPLKFGISFNAVHMNQAGALVHVYTDGSIRLNHGGTEMGQGLFVKVTQVVAEVFQVDLDRVRPSATSTAEVPNTSPTAASTGSDLNGWAAWQAAMTIRTRMIEFAATQFAVDREAIRFRDGLVEIGPPGANRLLPFAELAELCWRGRVSLSATGFYRTPEIHWDPVRMQGCPYFYFSYGAAVVEAAVDGLSGESRMLRADLVQDCGRSLNPAIDLGQIEGAFIQGMGWLTCEELYWDREGRLATHGPSTYKIPGSRDTPAVFNVHLLDGAPAPVATIFRSKATGEPPLMLATACWSAIRDAIAGFGDPQRPVELDLPATPERILMAIRARR